MSTQPQTEEYLAARRESCRLLGLNADDLTPHEMIRADLATVLRLWLDSSQSALLAGGSADPVKLLSVVEALTKLVPETEHKSRGEDPREIMWQTYLGMRRRGELADPMSTFEGARAEVERLRAKVAELEAGAAVPEEPSAPGSETSPNHATLDMSRARDFTAAPAPGGNVVPLPRATAGLSAQATPQPPKRVSPSPAAASAVLGDLVAAVDPSPQEPWREFIAPDGSISPTPVGGKKWWGPV
jgi:hypothetical protein